MASQILAPLHAQNRKAKNTHAHIRDTHTRVVVCVSNILCTTARFAISLSASLPALLFHCLYLCSLCYFIVSFSAPNKRSVSVLSKIQIWMKLEKADISDLAYCEPQPAEK